MSTVFFKEKNKLYLCQSLEKDDFIATYVGVNGKKTKETKFDN